MKSTETESEPISRGRGKPKKPDPLVEESQPHIRKKRQITTPWRYREHGKYITSGFTDREYHM